jgi:hypothetical protein
MKYYAKVYRMLHADEIEKTEQKWFDENPGMVVDFYKAWPIGGTMQSFLIHMIYHMEPDSGPPDEEPGQ